MAKAKGGLGKGLSALIRPHEEEHDTPERIEREPAAPVRQEGDSTIELEVEKIHPNPLQPRADFDSGTLAELVESIREKGIIQPVTVRRRGDGHYELISGERRIRALRELGKRTV